MGAGRYRHRITLQQKSIVRNAYGGETVTWTTLATVWAGVEPIRGREYFAADKVNSEVTHRIPMRYRKGVGPQLRVLWGTRVFNIEAVIDPEERHVELQLMTIEEV